MSRLIWVGVGAAGGILAYRRGQQGWERTKERGVAGNTAAITRTVAQVYRGIRDAEKPDLLVLTDDEATTRIIEPIEQYQPRADGATNEASSGRPVPRARQRA